ncbi:MAG: hypothetical protein RI841_12925 [Halomonas sp.]|uniref:hypothetical protein n=1 Tax=Halomonas sp. TaxID=1486246 RepID=UPI00286FE92E|nr:hypothetical protein [Halomonas sp.]MDR9440376.1 hypothetical protein [Halomonas sp.]
MPWLQNRTVVDHCLARGVVAIPSSTRCEHLAANLAALDTLGEGELEAIARLDRGDRIADPDFAPAWD